MSPAPLPASTDWIPLGQSAVVGVADEVAYGERQANVATAAAAGFANGADLLATALSFTADGATVYMVEFYVPAITNGGGNFTSFAINLDGAQLDQLVGPYGLFNALPAYGRHRITPAAGVHTLNVRMYSQGAFVSTALGGTGTGSGVAPIFVRLTRVSPYASFGGAGAGLPADTVVPSGTRIISNKFVSTDAQPSWQVMGEGKMNWGPGGATAVDTNLYRAAAGMLATDQLMAALGATGTQTAFGSAQTSAANWWWRVRKDGMLQWGDGSAAPDTSLYRASANVLRTDGWLSFAGTFIIIPGGGSPQIGKMQIGDGSGWYLDFVNSAGTILSSIRDNGAHYWGSARDAFIGRTGSGQLSVGGGAPQTNAAFSLRGVGSGGNSLEWGHGNPAGYGSVLGYDVSGGGPFIGFNCEAGTNTNTFRTRGRAGSLIWVGTPGQINFYLAATATADNQAASWLPCYGASFNAMSNRASKLDIREIGDQRHGWHDKLMKAKPYRFRRHVEDREHIGLMADELPDDVTEETPHNGGTESMVDLFKLITVLLGSVQILNERIAALEAKGETA